MRIISFNYITTEEIYLSTYLSNKKLIHTNSANCSHKSAVLCLSLLFDVGSQSLVRRLGFIHHPNIVTLRAGD